MSRFRIGVVAIAALIAVGLGGVGLAEPPGDVGALGGHGFGGHGGRGHGRGPEKFLEEHADELGLSAETRAAIEKIVEESRELAETLREAGREYREEIRALLQQPLPDEEEVMKLNDSASENRIERSRVRMQAMLDIRKLLNEAQRAKLVGIREERRAGHARFGALRACRSELPEVCPEASPGRETLQCLSEKWDDLSEECRGTFEDRTRRDFRRRQRWDAGEG